MPEIRLEKEGAIAKVTLANIGKLNAITVAMWDALAEVFTRISLDESLRCVIVKGEGHNFAAGADIEEFTTVRGNVAQGIHYHRETVANAFKAIANCLHPTIAAIEGVCVGGGLEVACACDLRIAHPMSRFGIPINRLGFAFAPEELTYLLELVGKAAALEILLEGRIFPAQEAKEKGLVHRIVDDVPAEAQKTAERIAQGAPLAARMNKKLIRRLSAHPEPLTENELNEAFALLSSQDYKEGLQAFLNKTKPVFLGK